MHNSLVEFTLCALGRVHEMQEPIGSREDVIWAENTITRLPMLLESVEASRTEPEPTTAQAAALAYVIEKRVRNGVRIFAESKVSEALDRPGAVELSRGKGNARLIWLENGQLKTEKRESASKTETQLNTNVENFTGPNFFAISWIQKGDKHLEFDPELPILRDKSLGFEFIGMQDKMSALHGKLNEGEELSRGFDKLIRTLFGTLNACGRDKELVAEADLACARKTAKILFPLKVQGPLASRFWLTGPRLGRDGNLSDLGHKEFNEDELTATNQAPETLALCSALASTLKLGPLGLGAAGHVKQVLLEEFGLTQAGWKGLVALCVKHPQVIFEIGQVCADAKFSLAEYAKAGYAKPMHSGGPTTEAQARLNEFCIFASLCAAGSVDFELGFRSVLKGLSWKSQQAPAVDLSLFLSLLSLAPVKWRQAVTGVDENGEAMPRVAQVWADVCARHGVQGETELSPNGLKKLEAAQWVPEGEPELEIMAYDRDRRARNVKAPTLVQSLLSRLRVLGLSSKKLDQEVNEVSDFLYGVELGFWDQAPEKINWTWMKDRAVAWHEHQDKEKASKMSWAPVEARGTGSGWIKIGTGWCARELVNGSELHDEGSDLRHCVSSYAEACSRGDCRVFSVRSEDGKGKSTLELEVERDATGREVGVKIVQHRGFANSEPSLLSKLAGQRVETHIMKKIDELLQSKPVQSPAA